MFSIFSKTKYIQDYIPAGYTDIHSHILFGIDDGAKTIDDSNTILKTLSNIGVERIITTPHISKHIWNNTPEIIKTKYSEICTDLSEITNKLSLSYAAEYLLDDDFMALAQQKALLTYKDAHVLVEFSYYNAPINYLQLFFELQLLGYTPVLAHPERYNYFHNQLEVFKQLHKMGVKLQLNLLSLVGYYGLEVQKMADQLLKNNLYTFTGSDLHHKQHCNSIMKPIKAKNINGLQDIMKNNIQL